MGLKRRSLLTGLAGSAVAAQAQEKEAGKVAVLMVTSLGELHIELDAGKAPITVKNFLEYVDEKHYDQTIFHRVVPEFVIQGGGFDPKLVQKKTRAPIKNEAGNGLKNLRGTLSMARTRVVDSATCQFFISLQDNPALDQRDDTAAGFGYAVFGRVTRGMEVVDKIAAVKTSEQGGHQNVPVEPVVIRSVRRK
ncbi:MAG: peptidyl-prolyl cis-trans isomerase [Armatimonadetes bacterium]|nr:peptidyl-prolyl cis-trans isomerase [Armatimonadota bacterium]